MTCLLAANNQLAWVLLGETSVASREMHKKEREFQDLVMKLVGLRVNW